MANSPNASAHCAAAHSAQSWFGQVDAPLILVVDDNSVTRAMLRQRIEAEGYRVAEARGSKECLEMYSHLRPDLVLLDWALPRTDSVTCCQTLTHAAGDLTAPVLVVIDQDDPGSVDRALTAGATDYVRKPIHWPLFRQRIQSLVQMNRALVAQRYQQMQPVSNALEQQVKARVAKLQSQVRQIQQALEVETLLKQIMAAFQERSDQTQILQIVAQELAWAFGVGCSAVLYDPEQAPAIVHQEYAESATGYCSRVMVIEENPAIYQQLQQGQVFQFCPISAPTLAHSQVAVLCCPLSDQAGVLGDLWLVSSAEQGLQPPQVQLVEQVAHQAAISIRQVQRYQTAQAQVLELGRLNQLKDEFLSTVSHELRSPLANIRLAIQLLEHSLTQGRTKCGVLAEQNAGCTKSLNYLKILHSECEEEISLINDLLDLQRLEAGRQVLTLEPIAVDTLILETVESFQERTSERQQTLSLDFATEVPTFVSDLNALRRILRELINNACKYTPPGEVIQVSARVLDSGEGTCGKSSDPVLAGVLTCAQGLFQLSIVNHGVEIPAQELPYIFDKFYRVPYGDRWKQGGTGLGLALVKKLVTYLGGSISVSSGAAQTCFILELPILSH